MNLESLHRRHWLVLGLMAGLALAYAAGLQEEPIPSAGGLSQEQFERELALTTPAGRPVLRHLVIEPPMRDALGRTVQVVRFDRLMSWRNPADGVRVEVLRPGRFIAPIPYGGGGAGTVADYLDQFQHRQQRLGGPKLGDYRTAWEHDPLFRYPLFGGTGAAAGGVLWPALLGVLIGAGWGRQPNPPAQDRPAARREEHHQAAKPPPSAADEAQLASAIEQLQAAAPFSSSPAALPQPVQANRARDFSQAADLPPLPPPQEPAPAEYQGEYYPVARSPLAPARSAPPLPFRGFTLIELLVGVGLMALLAGMLLPSLSAARRQALRVQCQSNLRQVGVLLTIYANDSGGQWFPYGLGALLPPEERWPVYVFKPPVSDPPALRCPADEGTWTAHSYLLNGHLWERDLRAHSTRFGGLSYSEVILMGEKLSDSPDYYLQTGEYPTRVEPYRHGLKAGSNYLYLDGHAGPLDRIEARTGVDLWDLPRPAP